MYLAPATSGTTRPDPLARPAIPGTRRHAGRRGTEPQYSVEEASGREEEEAGTAPAGVVINGGTTSTTGRPAGGRVKARPAARLHGLDGIRGVAALFVVLHHCWLLSFPGYPSNTGPWWLGWLIYGHFAVVVFIVLSGFSLSIAPARSGWQLRSVREFARRRAWRILPPYWAALAFSLAVAWWVVAQPNTDEPTAKSVVVYGFLVQDIFGSPSPNGAFWSIAVEAQLYLLFPLLLLVRRRWGAVVVLAAMTAIVVATAAAAPHDAHVDMLMRLTPQFAALFTAGIVAAGILVASDRTRRLPWHWLALIAVVPVVLVIGRAGSVWTVGNFVWVDLRWALRRRCSSPGWRSAGRAPSCACSRAGRCSGSAHARTACTSPMRRSW